MCIHCHNGDFERDTWAMVVCGVGVVVAGLLWVAAAVITPPAPTDTRTEPSPPPSPCQSPPTPKRP